MTEREPTLEDILRETPWSAILVPLALALLVILAVVVIVNT